MGKAFLVMSLAHLKSHPMQARANAAEAFLWMQQLCKASLGVSRLCLMSTSRRPLLFFTVATTRVIDMRHRCYSWSWREQQSFSIRPVLSFVRPSCGSRMKLGRQHLIGSILMGCCSTLTPLGWIRQWLVRRTKAAVQLWPGLRSSAVSREIMLSHSLHGS